MGPEMAAGIPEGIIQEQDVIPERLRVPCELAGHNPAFVFLELIIPWADFGVLDRDGEGDDLDQDDDGSHDANDKSWLVSFY
jgi:hypothetical protein